MWGMSLREYIELKLGLEFSSCTLNEILDDHVSIAHEILQKLHTLKILPLFKDYLRHGYYPFYFENRNEPVFFQLLNQNIHTSIESDLLSIHPSLTGGSIKKILALLKVIASSVPFLPDYQKMSRLLEIGDQRTLKTYLKYLEDCGIIISLPKTGKELSPMAKAEKILLNNTNLTHAFSPAANIGTMRETFFLNNLKTQYSVSALKMGDFLVDERYTFEVDGKNKDFSQIKDVENSFLVLDNMEFGFGRKIPLWLFGFLY